MSVNRARISSSYAEAREREGPLPWVVYTIRPRHRPFPAWAASTIAAAFGLAVGYLLLRAGL